MIKNSQFIMLKGDPRAAFIIGYRVGFPNILSVTKRNKIRILYFSRAVSTIVIMEFPDYR